MTNNRVFAAALFDELLASMFRIKPDLSLYREICQQPAPSGLRWRVKHAVRQLMRRFRVARIEPDNRSLRASLERLDPYWAGFQWLYEQLADERSRQTLVKVIAHRVLGGLHVVLPGDTPRYRELYEAARALEDATDELPSGFRNGKLRRMRLDSLGFPIVLYLKAAGVLATFGTLQYEYRDSAGRVLVGARPGDLVIDAGGCWGDTALFFAHRTGPDGRVFSYEFDPQNLEILRKNLTLNPGLEQRIEIIAAPLWSEAGQPMAITHDGPATHVQPAAASGSNTLRTATIDQLVSQRALNPVGLIKMDIEGAELQALHGAVETLRRDRPRLAISVYHSLDDFVNIPRFVADLNLGYRCYLDHQTIFDAETVLFAIAE